MSKAVKPASIVVCILAVSASAAPVTNVTVRAAANSAEKGGSVTFGQVFKRGDVKQGVLVSAPGASAQADVKRKYEDGSVRFAIISVMVPKWPPEMTVALSDGVPDSSAKSMPVRAADLLKTDFDATVTLRLSDGAERSASARKLLAAAEANARTWLEGPVATEWLLDGPLAGKDGQADPDLRVQFQVRAYAGCKAVRVSVVLENCLDTWAGNIGYDVAVTLGKEGKLAYAKKGVDHRRLSRWRKVFW